VLRVSLLLGLVYLISDSGLQKNQIRKSGNQESRKGIAEIEGKATRVGASECGQRASFNCCWPIRQAQGRLRRAARGVWLCLDGSAAGPHASSIDLRVRARWHRCSSPWKGSRFETSCP